MHIRPDPNVCTGGYPYSRPDGDGNVHADSNPYRDSSPDSDARAAAAAVGTAAAA